MAKKKAKPKRQPIELPEPVMSLADLPLEDIGADVLSALPPVSPSAPPPTPQKPTGPSFGDVRRATKALIEKRLREMEALRLYEPIPQLAPFHESRAQIRIVRGSNRAGKTLAAAAEFARALTGQDPHDKWPKENGRLIVVGHTETQLAGVIYPKLFGPRPFEIIKDGDKWRVFNPLTDKGRESEKRPAPPLIPRRFVKEIAWKDKKLGVPSKVALTTGWTINFFASGGVPPQGWDIDGGWIDEECDNQAWFPELVARLLDRKGRLVWSATPQVANPQLYEQHLRAAEEVAKTEPQVTEHIALLSDNPYIDESEKEKFAASLSDEERRVRIDGEFRLTGFKVYPEFSMAVHGYDGDGWQVPRDWSRYMVVDPGRQVCAVLFAAVPPPKEGNFILLYDELYIEHCDADKLGEAVAAKTDGIVYERMLIDSHAGRVGDMGYGQSVQSQYSAALKRNDVESAIGQNFVPGNDDVKAGILKVRECLRLREDGTPRLRVIRGRLPAFEKEIQRYHYKRVTVRGELLVTDEPEKKNDHLMDCMRYLCSYNPRWVKPKVAKKKQSWAVRRMEEKRRKQRQRAREDGSSFIRLGPNPRAA